MINDWTKNVRLLSLYDYMLTVINHTGHADILKEYDLRENSFVFELPLTYIIYKPHLIRQ